LSGRTAFAFHRRIRTITRLQAQWRWHRNPPLPPIPARTVLFRTAAHAADAAPDLNWRRRCPDLAVVTVEGDHRTMLDPPHLAALCTKFAAEVEAAAVLPSHP
jgi:thioesterase domain-containing protein